jgi:hypothetical protein
MQTPVEIDFQGMTAHPDLKVAIDAQVARLEERFGRVTACRVVLKAPSGHHQTGGLYEVNIHLALPDGRDVDVARTPDADERYADLAFALNDAFKRAPAPAGQGAPHAEQGEGARSTADRHGGAD